MAISRLRISGNNEERSVHPNHIIYEKMENVVNAMLDNEHGVPIKTVKSFLSKVPSVFTGQDLIAWIMKCMGMTDISDALHLAHLIAAHGYLFQIDDHVLTVKNDGTFYRFQTPYFWPSNCWEPENTDYAVYLCKRTMQNKAHLELEDFEAENLARLQKTFSRKWEFIFLQAEAQYKVDKKRDRQERQILDSQERAFWDVHRPVPGCVNTSEVDFRKLSRSGRPKYNGPGHAALHGFLSFHPHAVSAGNSLTSNRLPQCSDLNVNGSPSTSSAAIPDQNSEQLDRRSTLSLRNYTRKPGSRRFTRVQDSLDHEISVLQVQLTKNVLRTSKVYENHLQYFDRRRVFDPFLFPPGIAADPFQGYPNPWISDTVDYWQHDKMFGFDSSMDVSMRRLKLWEECFEELLADNIGRETLQKFLDKEYSGENLRFWLQVQKLRKCASRMVPVLVTEIYNEFIDKNATSPVNIDCKVMETTEENLKNPNRWSFDEAADHIFCLVKNDSYQRFLRSEIFRELLAQSKKKTSAPFSSIIARKASRKVSKSIRYAGTPGSAQQQRLVPSPSSSHITDKLTSSFLLTPPAFQ